MQTEWLPKSPKLSVAFEKKKLLVELSCGGVLFSGEMSSELTIDSQSAKPKSRWEVVCWHSDSDGDFLELECELDNGIRWQKHFLLARNDLFLFSADAFLNLDSKKFSYAMDWPLANETRFGIASETNEMFLIRKAKTVGTIIPIAMPEWKMERSNSSASLNAENFTLQISAEGQNVYCPFFIDLYPKRCRKPLTWRQLTVAENLEILKNDTACGYRVHIGDQQWLIYRSLQNKANRTVFGQNLSIEFYVGAMESDGTCAEIISLD